MNQHDFEVALLKMWTTTRIPLTRVNVQVYTDTPRERIDRWTEEMVQDGLLELDSDDDGEVLWKVRGAPRATTGPRTITEHQTLDRLRREVEGPRVAPRVLSSPSTPTRVTTRPGRAGEGAEKKSLVASGLLGFFLGPMGWLYAAPLKEALPAILGLLIVANLLPHSLFATLMGVVNPLSALAGVVYAWRHNQTGRRTPLLGGGSSAQLPDGRG